jgi:hypothetical protein
MQNIKFPGSSVREFFCVSFGDEKREVRAHRVLGLSDQMAPRLGTGIEQQIEHGHCVFEVAMKL